MSIKTNDFNFPELKVEYLGKAAKIATDSDLVADINMGIDNAEQVARLLAASPKLLAALIEVSCLDGIYRDAEERMRIAKAAISLIKQ